MVVLFKIYSSAYDTRIALPDVREIAREQYQAAKGQLSGSSEAAPVDQGTTPNPADSLPPAAFPGPRANATFVTLARNSDIWEISKSIRAVEDRFNRKFNYDWVFLNEQPFDDQFKKITTALVSGTAKYGLIPPKHWSFPEWIDQDKAKKVREKMVRPNTCCC
jgi:alpha 1,2-mannosyltransferase